MIPLEESEAFSVSGLYIDKPEKYGSIVELSIPPIDFEKLRKSVNKYLHETDTIIDFSGKPYSIIAIHKHSKEDLDNNKLYPYVRELCKRVGIPLFKQLITIASPGWETEWHRDQITPVEHGFRLIIPIDSFEIIFEEGIYFLHPGKSYFVNNSLLHKGRMPAHLSETMLFMADMASDDLVLKGSLLKPNVVFNNKTSKKSKGQISYNN